MAEGDPNIFVEKGRNGEPDIVIDVDELRRPLNSYPMPPVVTSKDGEKARDRLQRLIAAGPGPNPQPTGGNGDVPFVVGR